MAPLNPQDAKQLGQPAREDVVKVRGVAIGPVANKYAAYKNESPVSTLGRVIKNLFGGE